MGRSYQWNVLFLMFLLAACGGQEQKNSDIQSVPMEPDGREITATNIGAIPDIGTISGPEPQIGGGLNDHWFSMNNATSGTSIAYAMVVSNGKVYIGGNFTTINGVAANRVAMWDGTTWSALGDGVNNTVYALAVSSDGTLYAAGIFTTAGGVTANRIAKWDGAAWSPLGSGIGNNTVYALAVSGTDLYAGGNFTTAGGATANRVAKWDGAAWSKLGTGVGNNIVYVLAVLGSDLYVGGTFTKAGGATRNRIARWNGSAWSALGTGMNNSVRSLAVNDGTLYAGGNFTTAGGVTVSRIAQWNGTAWSALTGGGMTNNVVYALAISGGDLYGAGTFTTVTGGTATRIAKWNGTAWSALGSGLNNTGWAVAVDGNDIYAAGAFSKAGNKTSRYIARHNTAPICGDGILDPGETCEASGTAWGCCSTDCSTILSAGTTCRASAGVCDPAEVCDGISGICPANAFKPNTTVCRAASGACNLAEYCTGSTAACPTNTNYAPAGTVCRAVAGVCDVVETCTGASNTCPTNAFLPNTAVCRPSAGVCDVVENCTGTAAACPTDLFQSASTVCNLTLAGDCDAVDLCSGTAAPCPDMKLDGATECRSSMGICDVAEQCDGANNDCPADAFQPATFECRPSTIGCDPAENCTGGSVVCPADVYECHPIPVLIDPVSACTRRTTGTISFTAEGATGATCRLDKPDSTYAEGSCSSPAGYTLDGGDGTYTFTVNAHDDIGNTGTAAVSFTFDTTEPTFQWQAPENGTLYLAGSSVPSFLFRAKNLEAGETVEIWDVDANAKVAEATTAGSLCNATEDVSIALDLPDKCGAYKLYAKVYDNVSGLDRYTDNLTGLPATERSFTFDRNKPVIASFIVSNDANGDDMLIATEDLDGGLAGMQATIVITVQDPIDIGRTVSLRNKTTESAHTAVVAGDRTATFVSITIPEGANNFGATLTDCGGNPSEENARTVTVDMAPPSVLFLGPTGTTPDHPLWLTARDGAVNGSDELTGQQLKFTITGDWNGATPLVRHFVYDYMGIEVGTAYTYTAGEMPIDGTTVTIDLAPLAYNKHRFEVTVQDAGGNTRIVSRTYEVDPIVPNAVIAYPTDGQVLDTEDEDPEKSGIQFTMKLDIAKLATPTGTASTIDILAIPVTAVGGEEDTTRSRRSWNGFTATLDGDDLTFPNDGSTLTLGNGFWRLTVKATDDHLNVYDTATLPLEEQVDIHSTACYIVLKLTATDKLIEGRQAAPTWLNIADGAGPYALHVETDAADGSDVTLTVNGTATYGPVDAGSGIASFIDVALTAGGAENAVTVSVDNGFMVSSETYYVRVDLAGPYLRSSGVAPALHVTTVGAVDDPAVNGENDDLWELGYGWNDDIDHGTADILELDGASVNRIVLTVEGVEDIAGLTAHGTVTLTAVAPAGAIGGTTTVNIVKNGSDAMVAEFADLSFTDSVAGGQTDIELLATITEQPSGNTYDKPLWVRLDLEQAVGMAPVVTTDPARGSAFVQWLAAAGNNSAYAGPFKDRMLEYQVKYESYGDVCSLDDDLSVFDTGAAILPLDAFAVVDPSPLTESGFIPAKEAGEAQSYRFHFNKRQNTAGTATADIHRNGDKYCFALRAKNGVYAQDGTLLTVNYTPFYIDKGMVQFSQSTLIAAANDGQTHPGQMKYIGDLNSDGITDFVYSDVRLQKVSVFISAVGAAPTKVELAKPGDSGTNFGLYVSNGGDFNGDGELDLLVYGATNQLHLYTGTGATINTTRTGSMITTSDTITEVEAIGDFNGDGIDDFAVGQNGYSSNTGKVDVFFGNTNAAEIATVDATYTGSGTDRFGSGIHQAGDLNGDGYGDFVAGTRDSSTKVEIFYGSAAPTGGAVTYDFTVFGNNAVRKSFYGRIDGDSYDDFAIVGGSVMYIYKGSATGVVIPGVWTEGVNKITHSAILTELLGSEGTSGTLAAACTGQMRDIDGDGYADIFLTGAYSQYLLSGTGSFLTLHPSVYLNKPIAAAYASVMVVENGLVICDRTSGRGDCVFYRE